MFKCKECGQEFDIQPQYCDCGNDEFETIKEEVILPTNEFEFTHSQELNREIIENRDYTIPKERISTFAIFIFILCIICSLIIIFYPTQQTKTDNIQNKQIQDTSVSKELPQISKLWNDNSTHSNHEASKEKTQQQDTEEKNEIKGEIKDKVQIKVQPQTEPKVIQSSRPINEKNTAVPNTRQIQNKIQSSHVTTTQKQPTTIKVVNKDELIRYKAALRNKIASRINFAGIIGDGTCIITFSISQSGELQKHKFKKQSENFSLNDAVYNAIMQTQFYNPPPDGYNGEIMQFVVKIYNGNYEVTLN